MKKKNLIILGTVLLIFFGIAYKIDSAFEELSEIYKVEHSLDEQNLILISDSISPNQEYIYYEYMFDQGALGYSRTFLAVSTNNNDSSKIFEELIPYGYKILG